MHLLDDGQLHRLLGVEVLEEAALGQADRVGHVAQADAASPRSAAWRAASSRMRSRVASPLRKSQASLLDKK